MRTIRGCIRFFTQRDATASAARTGPQRAQPLQRGGEARETFLIRATRDPVAAPPALQIFPAHQLDLLGFVEGGVRQFKSRVIDVWLCQEGGEPMLDPALDVGLEELQDKFRRTGLARRRQIQDPAWWSGSRVVPPP